jgi:hypothetical protein
MTYSDETTITQGELIKALEVIGYGRHGRANAESWVRAVLDHVREPRWRGGDIVLTRSGSVFIKLFGSGGWRDPVSDREVTFEHPGRPLKKIGVTG